jgi:DUF1680 family protein
VTDKKNHKTFVVDTRLSPYAKLRPAPIENVHLEDNFWAPRLRLLQEVTLPTQHKLCEETGRISNFKRAARKETGEFKGYFFNDSDIYKWIEATAFSMADKPSQELTQLVEQATDEILAAQDANGYLDSYFTLDREKDRWTNLRDMHELYCAGHLIQAAIAIHRSAGDKLLLNAAVRLSDHIASVFDPSKREGTPGHPGIEMALVELYRTTCDDKYLHLAQFFIDNRGKGLIGGRTYHIDHRPFRELTEIVGHAVRAIYLNCGAADLYMETGEQVLLDALIRLWQNMTERKMYVTGGVGARHEGEAFGEDYELPNARAYAETCAAIASVMWNWRMLTITGEARFTDIMELALYNGVLSGISLDGQRYFYTNPLADHGKQERKHWFDCACCPPNIARLLASLPGYCYSLSDNGVWIHLYAQNTAHLQVNHTHVIITQRTNYPWDGKVKLELKPEQEALFSLYLRIPSWCAKAEVQVNGKMLDIPTQQGHYIEVCRSWKTGDVVTLSLAMPVERIVCNPLVIENNDRVALKRGPIIYCLEQVDNGDRDVGSLVLPNDSALSAEWAPNLLNGVMIIRGEALSSSINEFKGELYRSTTDISSKLQRVQFTAIPYYAWANRTSGPMTVWIRSLRHQKNG